MAEVPLNAETFAMVKEMEEAIVRIQEADPEAYGGFVVDEAARAVGRRHGVKATDVVRAYRAVHPRHGPWPYWKLMEGKTVSIAGKAVA